MKSSKYTILSNTFLLFLRMCIITSLNLFSLRFVIERLGQEDYGLFTAVASLVLISSCLIPVLSLSLQRFYSFYIGQNDLIGLRQIFSVSVNIVIITSLVVFIVLETIGEWFICNHMSIPEIRQPSVLVAFHFTVISFIFSLFQIPFYSAIFANEDMGIYTIISTIDCILKFTIAFTIGLFNIDKLVYYSLGLCLTSLLSTSLYIFTGLKKYEEYKYILVKDKLYYYKLLSFSIWTILSSFAGMGLIQGSSILLNIFFGSLANAAFGVANNIYNAFITLSNSLSLAFRPTIIKLYSSGNHFETMALFNIFNKSLLFLFIMVAIPFIIEMPTLLKWWLGYNNPLTTSYCRFFVLYTICFVLHNPITTIIQASGSIKKYTLYCDLIIILHVPISWIMFQLGLPSYFLFISIIGVCALAHINRIICIRRVYALFSTRDYVYRFLVPYTIITSITVAISYIVHTLVSSDVLRLFTVSITNTTVLIALVYYLGTNMEEREAINKLASKIRRRRTK